MIALYVKGLARPVAMFYPEEFPLLLDLVYYYAHERGLAVRTV